MPDLCAAVAVQPQPLLVLIPPVPLTHCQIRSSHYQGRLGLGQAPSARVLPETGEHWSSCCCTPERLGVLTWNASVDCRSTPEGFKAQLSNRECHIHLVRGSSAQCALFFYHLGNGRIINCIGSSGGLQIITNERSV